MHILSNFRHLKPTWKVLYWLNDMTVKCSCITFLNQLHVFPSAYMYYEG